MMFCNSPDVTVARPRIHCRSFFWPRALASALCAAWLIPDAPAAFIPAPEPGPASAPSPLIPSAQQAQFRLPPGFEIELVSSEEQGVGKPITVAWDDAGSMWTMTALEYPVDANESAKEAEALYKSHARDKVLVFDDPYAPGPVTPRVFADGLAIPSGILPTKDGVLVQHGHDLLLMKDTDGDGRADRREVLLTGFGIDDSHLMPHQFMRAPGGWYYLAQGAFNYSKVKTRDGQEHRFDQTRLARFTLDGMKFEDITCGPCNIWGMAIDRQGETFIQEANDFGYPVMLMQVYGSYPGCSGAFRPYAPYHPSEVDFRVGGTGLSGLALSDPKGLFPGDYADIAYVANPITRKIQAIKIHREGPRFRYEMLGDFVLSADEWFRPVSIHFGPDGALYIVDWYNKIISHNEVPRAHPDRDKSRGRIWRVRPRGTPRLPVPDMTKASETALLKYLHSQNTWEARAAWHQITDRKLIGLASELRTLITDGTADISARIHALWTLEELGQLQLATIDALLKESNRNLRREAIRSLSLQGSSAAAALPILRRHTADPDPEVRAEAIRTLGKFIKESPAALDLMVRQGQVALDAPVGKSPHSGQPMKLREAYDRDFERYLVRRFLEQIPDAVEAYLKSPAAADLPIESRLLAILALPPARSVEAMAEALPKVTRPISDEEILRLAEGSDSEPARAAMARLLGDTRGRSGLLESLLRVRTRLDVAKIAPVLERAGPTLIDGESSARELGLRVAGAFRVASLAQPISDSLASNAFATDSLKIAALRALREMQTGDPAVLARLTKSGEPSVRQEALLTLASSKQSGAPEAALALWPGLSFPQRRALLDGLSGRADGARALVAALEAKSLEAVDLSSATWDRLLNLLPDHPGLNRLLAEAGSLARTILRLNGAEDAHVQTDLTLDGPFTVEAWLKLDPGISNADGILAGPGGLDLNFAGARFRAYAGPGTGDVIIAKKATVPDSWTHYAAIRDAQGLFRLYINGELDNADSKPAPQRFEHLRVGWTSAGGGTAGTLTEFRIWNRARSAEEIRADFDRTYEGEARPAGLVYYGAGSSWGDLAPGARAERVTDFPKLLTASEAAALAQKFDRYRQLAQSGGDAAHGQQLFATTCMTCHSVGGQGAQIGPVLGGAGAMGIDALVRAVLTPNAAMEAGYRNFRIELNDGEMVEGFLAAQDAEAFVIRRPNAEDVRIAQKEVRRAGHTRTSIMPEGLLEALAPSDVQDLFAYLRTLK